MTLLAKTAGVPSQVPPFTVNGDDDQVHLIFEFEAATIAGIEFPAAVVRIAIPHAAGVKGFVDHLIARSGNENVAPTSAT